MSDWLQLMLVFGLFGVLQAIEEGGWFVILLIVTYKTPGKITHRTIAQAWPAKVRRRKYVADY